MLNLTISEARTATADEWDTIWKGCDYSTYYHSREWAEIWQEYTSGKMKPDGMLIIFSDVKRVLLPFSSQRILKGIFKQYILSPAGTFGGWLSCDELTDRHGNLLAEYILAHCKNLTWRLNPYNELETCSKLKDYKSDETHTLNLEHGFECIYKGWTKGHSSAARKARKAGVEIREATTLQDWKDYYEIYEDSLRRWGNAASSRYEWQLFKIMHDLSSCNIKLWLAIFDNKIIAGALCLYAKKHVGYWHGSALSEYFKMRPVNLLMFEIIKDSCEHDYQWFDFNPSGGHEGVRNFKRSFGAVSKSCPVVQVRNSKIITMVEYSKNIINKIKMIIS